MNLIKQVRRQKQIQGEFNIQSTTVFSGHLQTYNRIFV